MARFHFALQPVLEMREREERERQVIVSRIEAERRDLEEAISAYQAQLSSCKAAQRDAMLGDGSGVAVVNASELRVQAGATLGLHAKAQQAALRLAGVLSRLERARAALAEAAKARRAVELLKERRYEEWKRERAKREAMELDDLASGRAAREAELASPVRGVEP